MNPEDVKRHFEETGGLLSGHFKLSSGLHSDRYLQCAKVLQWPDRAAQLGAALGELLRPLAPGLVVSPAMGGLIIGHEVGRALGVRAVFAERVDGAFVFRRGFSLTPGEKVVVIEDVVTTGKSTLEVVDVVRVNGGVPVGCGSIVDRRGPARAKDQGLLEGLPMRTLLPMEISTWEPADCPYCRVGQTLVAPGSRFLATPPAPGS